MPLQLEALLSIATAYVEPPIPDFEFATLHRLEDLQTGPASHPERHDERARAVDVGAHIVDVAGDLDVRGVAPQELLRRVDPDDGDARRGDLLEDAREDVIEEPDRAVVVRVNLIECAVAKGQPGSGELSRVENAVAIRIRVGKVVVDENLIKGESEALLIYQNTDKPQKIKEGEG